MTVVSLKFHNGVVSNLQLVEAAQDSLHSSIGLRQDICEGALSR